VILINTLMLLYRKNFKSKIIKKWKIKNTSQCLICWNRTFKSRNW